MCECPENFDASRTLESQLCNECATELDAERNTWYSYDEMFDDEPERLTLNEFDDLYEEYSCYDPEDWGYLRYENY